MCLFVHLGQENESSFFRVPSSFEVVSCNLSLSIYEAQLGTSQIMFHQQKQWNTVGDLFVLAAPSFSHTPKDLKPDCRCWFSWTRLPSDRACNTFTAERSFIVMPLGHFSNVRFLFLKSSMQHLLGFLVSEWTRTPGTNSIPNQKIHGVDIILECSIVCFFFGPLFPLQGFLTNNSPLGASLTIMFFLFHQRIGTMNCHQRSSPRIFWCPVSVQSFATLVLLKQWQMQVWNVPGTSWLQSKTKEFWKKEVKCEFRLNTEFLCFFCGYRCQVVTVFVFSLPLHILLLFPFRGWAGGSHLNMLPRRWLQRIPWTWQARKGGTHFFFGMQVVVISRPWKSSQTAKSKKFPKCVA